MRSLVATSALVVLGAACSTRVVDLGEPRPTAPQSTSTAPKPDGAAPVLVGCAEWNDQEIGALRGDTCVGKCTDLGAVPYALASRKALIAATAGRWLFCDAKFGPGDAVGVEFEPGCRLAFLTVDTQGDVVRGTTAAWEGSYDIVGEGPRLELHDHLGNTTTATVAADHCPNLVTLHFDDGPTVRLSSDVPARVVPPL